MSEGEKNNKKCVCVCIYIYMKVCILNIMNCADGEAILNYNYPETHVE